MQEIWHKDIYTKTILLDGPVSCNLKHSPLISSTGYKNTLLLSPATALFHGNRQTAGSDFDGFLPAKFGGGKHFHLRPIENYSAALKQAVYAGSYLML